MSSLTEVVLVKIHKVVFNIKVGSKTHLFLRNRIRDLWKPRVPVCREATALSGLVALKGQSLKNMHSSPGFGVTIGTLEGKCVLKCCVCSGLCWIFLRRKNTFIKICLLLKTCCSSFYREDAYSVQRVLHEARGYGKENISSCRPDTSVT